MLAQNYSYEILEEGNKQTIVLTQHSTGLTKAFESVAKSVAGLRNHMESLTGVNCDEFFPKPKKK